MISVYLWDGEGLTDRNRAILFAVGEAIKRHGGPWLIGGDFNTTPGDVVESMKEWLKTIGGKVCATVDITCRSQSGGRTIDFFIIDDRISHGVVDIWTVIDFASSPH